MAVAFFFLFSGAVLIAGLIFVALTLRHHYRLDRQERERLS